MPVSTELANVDYSLRWVSEREFVTSVGLRPSVMQRLGKEDVLHLLAYAGSMEDISKWLLADLLVWGEGRIKKKLGTDTGKDFWIERDALWDIMLTHFKSELSVHTRYNMVACAKRWHYSRRKHTNTLSFEHHRVVVPLSDDEQDYWLDLCEDNNWSVARLRSEIQKGGDPLNREPHVQVYTPLWTEQRIRDMVASYVAQTGEMQGYMYSDDAVYLAMKITQEYELEREGRK